MEYCELLFDIAYYFLDDKSRVLVIIYFFKYIRPDVLYYNIMEVHVYMWPATHKGTSRPKINLENNF